MGIRGLTTFIGNKSRQYLERYELQNCYVVLDGNSISYELYKWAYKCNDCFGGDYDKYDRVVHNFFQLLSRCRITPLVILDGAYENRKLKTIYTRMKNRISAARNLNSVSERKVTLFPLFLRELFVDIMLKLQIKCVRCEFEGDRHAAHLARTLRCPIMSFDSDFYIFDVIYIPFSTVELRSRKNKFGNYVPCEVYRIEKFLNSFGLDKMNLPLLAVMLGNDYITKSAFSLFYQQMKKQKTQENEQQTLIKSVIMWLKNETPESALRKILGRYKLQNRRELAWRIQEAIEGYQGGNTQICSYFNIVQKNVKTVNIVVPNPEDIEDSGEDELVEDEKVDEEDIKSKPPIPHIIPNFFRENYRNCLYPPCFMDMLTSDTYYCIQQIEDFSSEFSHSVSLKIIAAIYKILTFPNARDLTCVARDEQGHLKKYSVSSYERTDVPTLTDIESMDTRTCKITLLNILNIQDNIFNSFPNSWHLFLISIKYWVNNSKTKVELGYIYSLILCRIILNYVDRKVGFYRSTKYFFDKFGTNPSNTANTINPTEKIIKALDKIDFANGVNCMKKLIHYFQMDAKMKRSVELFDRKIVHQFAQFQSCLLHIKYLNSLLNFPFSSPIVSEFYDGTFLYNMTANFLKKDDLKAYVKILLQDCPKILYVFESIIESIEEKPTLNVNQVPKKRKKKKKRVKKIAPEVILIDKELGKKYTVPLLSLTN